MKRKEVLRQKTILAMTAEEWDERVNAALDDLAVEMDGRQDRPNIERSRTEDGGFLAIIEYWVAFDEPETIRDEFIRAGEVYRCQDCPHLRRERDRRYRWLTCEQGMKSCTKETAEACDWFYEQIAKAKKEEK